MVLFRLGLLGMFIFILISNALNYVSIATTQWLEGEGNKISLWTSCYYPGNVDPIDKQNAYRPKCFKDVPPALIATGTAFNGLSLLLVFISLFALFNAKFRKAFSTKLVTLAELATLLSLLFNSTGWYFMFNAQYQNTFRTLASAGNPKLITPGFRFGWSFWLLAGSFAASLLAALFGSSLLGYACIINQYESSSVAKTTKSYQKKSVLPKYVSSDPILTMYNYKEEKIDEMRF